MPGRQAKRHVTLTPKRRSALKVQGRYIGLLRTVPEKMRRGVQDIARARGAAEAIKVMEREEQLAKIIKGAGKAAAR